MRVCVRAYGCVRVRARVCACVCVFVCAGVSLTALCMLCLFTDIEGERVWDPPDSRPWHTRQVCLSAGLSVCLS